MKNITDAEFMTERNSALRQIIFIFSALVSITTVAKPYMTSSIEPFICCLCGMTATLLCIWSNKKKLRFPMRTTLVAVMVVICAVLFKKFFGGFAITANTLISLINAKFNTQYLYINGGSSKFDSFVFFMPIVIMTAVSMEALTKKRKYGAIIIFLFLNFECSQFLMAKYSFIEVVVMLVAFSICWSLGNRFIGRGVMNTVFTILAVGGCAVIALVAFSGFRGSQGVEMAKNRVVETGHKLRFGDDILPDGNLAHADSMHSDRRMRLRLSSDAPIDDELYLRGFTGAEFDGYSCWKDYVKSDADSEWNGMFGWLKKNDFNVQTRYAASNPEGKERKIIVSNTGADRSRVYVPFSFENIVGRYKLTNDMNVLGRGIMGTRSYLFYYFSDAQHEDILIDYSTNGSDTEISDTETVYSAYTQSVYTRIDDDIKQKIDKLFFDTEYINEETGLYSTITRIRAILELSGSRSRREDYYNAQINFVDWFINGHRQSVSAYYATMGTLALRSAGYPARYVEGYYVMGNKSREITLTSSDGHAWSEVYIDGKGWIPVEFTPGYYRRSLLNKKTVEISSDNVTGGADNDNKYHMTEKYDEDAAANDEHRRNSYTMHKDIMLKVYTLLIIFVLMIIFGIIRFVYTNRYKKKMFASEEPERYVFSCIMQIIKLSGIECSESKPLECIDALTNMYPKIRAEEYDRVVSIMQKSVFGEEKLERREIHTLMSFYKKVRQLLYQKSKRFTRLKLKYLDIV